MLTLAFCCIFTDFWQKSIPLRKINWISVIVTDLRTRNTIGPYTLKREEERDIFYFNWSLTTHFKLIFLKTYQKSFWVNYNSPHCTKSKQSHTSILLFEIMWWPCLCTLTDLIKLFYIKNVYSNVMLRDVRG